MWQRPQLLRWSGRIVARAAVGEGFPFPLFRLRGGVTVSPWRSVPRSPLRFRKAGFPRYGSKAGLSDGAFPDHLSVKLAPSMPVAGQVCVHPSCSPRQHASSVLSRRPPARWNTAMRATYVALLHGSSLRFGRGRDASYLAPPAPIRTCTLMHTALTLGV